MIKKYQKIWRLALPCLRKGFNKDFVLHTKGVVAAMELILKKEKGDPDILIPAAILHDVGWAKIPHKYQHTNVEKNRLRGRRLHLELAPAIIKKILREAGYGNSLINKIIEVVAAHEFKKPKNLNKRILIDADQLSTVSKKEFYSDCKSYRITPEANYNYRIKDNYFYTKTAQDIFSKQMEERRKELKIN
jgi:HD superfamily phosphodiesterase